MFFNVVILLIVSTFAEQALVKEHKYLQNDILTKKDCLGCWYDGDPTLPKYKIMAEEAVRKYLSTHSITHYYAVSAVERVSEQVVAGLNTKISFNIWLTSCSADIDGYPTSNNCEPLKRAKVIPCNSLTYDRLWENTRNITVNCELKSNDKRSKRQILVGGWTEKNASSPKYKELAEEALQKYMLTHNLPQTYGVFKVDRVLEQLVSGLNTKIDFLVLPILCVMFGDCRFQTLVKPVLCNSLIYEEPWENIKDITVDCAFENNRRNIGSLLQCTGCYTEQDPRLPEYQIMAEEAVRKYILNNSISTYYAVVEVEKVSTQVVSGVNTNISFAILPTSCPVDREGYPLYSHCELLVGVEVTHCNSLTYEQPWTKTVEITVNCELKSNDKRSKRQILVGGWTEKNASSPKYKELAEEALQKYMLTHNLSQTYGVFKVDRVLEQLVSGLNTKIDFLVLPILCAMFGDCRFQTLVKPVLCNSLIYEEPWENIKDITVDCAFNSDNTRTKRSTCAGCWYDGDPTLPKYKIMAEEAVRKYLSTHSITHYYAVSAVERVSEQVVAGLNTKIYFSIWLTSCSADIDGYPTSNNCEHLIGDEVIPCNSLTYDRRWENTRNITVDCAF